MRAMFRVFFKLIRAFLMLLGTLVVAGGLYLFFVPKGIGPGLEALSPPPPDDLNAPLVLALPSTPAGNSFTEITGQLVVPPILQPEWPGAISINPALSEVEGNIDVPMIPDPHVYDPQTKIIHFWTKTKENTTYLLELRICALTPAVPCNFFAAKFNLKVEFEAGKDKKIDLGNIYVNRRIAWTPNGCDSNQPSFSGEVITTKNFPRRPSPGKKFVLVALKYDLGILRSSPYFFDKDVSAARGGKRLIGTLAQSWKALYSGPFEAKPEGFHFSIPDSGSDPGPLTGLFVYECDEKTPTAECGSKIKFVPSNTESIPGQIYRLVPEHRVNPLCNAKNVKFFAHLFGPPGEPVSFPHQTDPAIPEEIIEGIVY